MMELGSPVSVLETSPVCGTTIQEMLKGSCSDNSFLFDDSNTTPNDVPFCDDSHVEESTRSLHDDFQILRSQLSTKQQHVVARMEERIQAAEQEAIRHRAMVLLYQDELRSLTTQTRANNKAPDIDHQEWRERRRSMHHLKEVTREHSALVALRERALELESLREIAVKGETRIVRLEIENQMLQQSLQEGRSCNQQLAEEGNVLGAENRKLRSKAKIFGQRMLVAEQERNCLRRRTTPSRVLR
jgi:hypothetical protein